MWVDILKKQKKPDISLEREAGLWWSSQLKQSRNILASLGSRCQHAHARCPTHEVLFREDHEVITRIAGDNKVFVRVV